IRSSPARNCSLIRLGVLRSSSGSTAGRHPDGPPHDTGLPEQEGFFFARACVVSCRNVCCVVDTLSRFCRMNLILFDDPQLRVDLSPFTMTRPTGNLRVGIMTIDEKWSARLGVRCSFLTEAYLQHKFPLQTGTDNLLINGALCPDDDLLQAICRLEPEETLVAGDTILASRTENVAWPVLPARRTVTYGNAFVLISKPWKIFEENAAQIQADIPLVT